MKFRVNIQMATTQFNVGGNIMEISTKLIQRFPESRLLQYTTQKQPIFLDYNPYAFMVILDYLRTDTLYIPRNVSKDLVIRLLKELNITFYQTQEVDSEISLSRLNPFDSPTTSNSGIRSPTQDNALPPAYFEASNFGQSTSGISKTSNQSPVSETSQHRYTQSLDSQQKALYKKMEPMIFADLLPLISGHVDQGHTRVRIYIVPDGVTKDSIANNTEEEDLGFPKEFYKAPETMLFLMQPKALELLLKTIKYSTGIDNTKLAIRNITIRSENAFGLYESKSIDILVLTLVFPPNCAF